MSDDDPFDRLDPDDDREGDPFERLGPVDEESTEREPAADEPTDQQVGADPWGPPGEDQRDVTSGTDDSTAADSANPAAGAESSPGTTTGPTPAEHDDDPFSGVSTPDESPFDAGGPSVFERVDAGGADPDQVWEAITSEDDDEDEPAEMPEDGRYSEVSKHTYCEGCEHFSPPPDVTCTHETAEIIEFLDMETVRLLDCPIVAEREALERGE